MSEKSRLPSRFHFYLITISLFLLVLSSVFLLQFRNAPLIPKSVFELILVNTTSLYSNANVGEEHIETSQVVAERPSNSKEPPFPLSNNLTKKASSFIRQKLMACDPTQARLRVYMYDLPPEFHFGLLGWKGKRNQTWPSVNDPSQIPAYPGGLNLQHSIEYWLTLDLLSSNVPKISRPCTAIRVKNSSQADIIFVPFFASLSYNRHSKLRGKEKVSVNKRLQEQLVQFLTSRQEWKRHNGKNHVIVAHHPNSMLDARRKLGSAMFVLADFGRYPVEIANLDKDIIAPYRHLVTTVRSNQSASFLERPILAYFKGAIYRKDGGVIRQELFYLLKDEKDVHFNFGSIRGNGINQAGQGMASSKFCLHIAGDTPSSNRLFDAIASHCVPVIISDDIELPFEDVLDYTQFCIFVPAPDAIQKGYLLNLLRGIEQDKWTKMWERLKEITHLFEYQYPSQSGDAVDMIWEAVSRKVSSIRYDSNRNNRYNRSRPRTLV
ncbi:putative glycosyltransferase [Morus notabilis]|uniref:Putative glycosyltransferase n=1 Tax=Morus notabilis TaxID=981085 RepID=W9QNG9_9ROSA|nr:probable arabinosyltransferase ARAD1 [Morus notabilis]EXB44689.1 putative glycosyltransferase [Morus notabilis]